MASLATHTLLGKRKESAYGKSRWYRSHGGCTLLVLVGEFVFVGEYAVATIDIAPCEWLWRLLYESFAYLWFMGSWGVKPGFGQGVR